MEESSPSDLEAPPPVRAELDWKDEVPVSREFQDIFFSRDDGLRESRHVFLRNNDLARRFSRASSESFNICELGFGTGLNFLLTRRLFLRLAPPESRLTYIAVEKHPMEAADMVRALSTLVGMSKPARELADALPPSVEGFHQLMFGERVVLLLYYGDVARCLSELSISANPDHRMHAWFLDGFAPAKNPEMWTPAVFAHMARLSAPDATLATFTAASAVRRGLEAIGFRMEKTRGFGRKRDMLRGANEGSQERSKSGIETADARAMEAPWYTSAPDPDLKDNDASHVLIIGAGLAGSAAAFALARRGVRVTVLEKGDHAAAGASGTAAGIMLPVLSARSSHFSRYSLAAYHHILRRLEDREQKGKTWDAPGLVQLYITSENKQRLNKALENLRLPETVVRALDVREAGDFAGMELSSGGLFFPGGAWVDPALLCRRNLDSPRIDLKTNQDVRRIRRHGESWQALDGSDRVIASAPKLILAAALDCARFEQTEWMPLVRVRGQLFILPAIPPSLGQKAIICYDGYMLPNRDGHVVGATFELDKQDAHPDPELNFGLYQAMIRNVPGLRDAFESKFSNADEFQEYLKSLPARAAFRAATRDRFPIIGPVPDRAGFAREYQNIAIRSHRTRSTYGDDFPPGPVLPGLYVSTGHGSRGLIYSGLGGEYLAALITNEPSPIARDIAEALHPARFLIRKLKSGPLDLGR